MTPKITIYLSYHKPAVLLESEVFHPIHVGRSLNLPSGPLCQIIGDDTGDNISKKNQTFCELTAQYWVWKTDVDSDYVGFMHYRRHLDFNDLGLNQAVNRWGTTDDLKITKDYLFRRGLFDSCVREVVQAADIVLPRKWDVTNAGSKNNYDHYLTSDKKLHISDYDTALAILKEKYPDMECAARCYNESKFGYYTNIFVMKRQLFAEYSAYLFSILFELEKRVDLKKYDIQERRVFGYISEWLFGIYITYLKQIAPNLRIIELNRTFVEHPDEPEVNDIHICTSCDDNYVEALSVSITSILVNKNKEDVIYYYVLDGGIQEKNKKLILSLPGYGEDFFIYFVPVNKSRLQTLEKTVDGSHISLSTYYRLLLGSLLPDYVKRVLYLDCDTVVRTSLSDLYFGKMSTPFMGVKDVLEPSNTKRLNLRSYVNAGVLLIDLEFWRSTNVEKKLFDYANMNIESLVYNDQDVLNVVMQSSLSYLNPLWNAQTASYPGSEEQNEIGKNAFIVHFVSDRKPWIKGNANPFESEWFYYREKSPCGRFPFHFKSSSFKRGIKNWRYYQLMALVANRYLPKQVKVLLKQLLRL